MLGNLFHIKINSSEANKDEGFFTLMLSGASIFCLKNEEYIVPENAILKLKEKDIKYEVVIEKEASKKIGDCNKDASQT